MIVLEHPWTGGGAGAEGGSGHAGVEDYTQAPDPSTTGSSTSIHNGFHYYSGHSQNNSGTNMGNTVASRSRYDEQDYTANELNQWQSEYFYESSGYYNDGTFFSADQWFTDNESAHDNGTESSRSHDIPANVSSYAFTQAGPGGGFSFWEYGISYSLYTSHTGGQGSVPGLPAQIAGDGFTISTTARLDGFSTFITDTTINVITGTLVSTTTRDYSGNTIVSHIPSTTTTEYYSALWSVTNTSAMFTKATISFSTIQGAHGNYSYSEIIPERNATCDDWLWIKAASAGLELGTGYGGPFQNVTDVFTEANGEMVVYPALEPLVSVTPIIYWDGTNPPTFSIPVAEQTGSLITVNTTGFTSNTFATIGYNPFSHSFPMPEFIDSYNYDIQTTLPTGSVNWGISNRTLAAWTETTVRTFSTVQGDPITTYRLFYQTDGGLSTTLETLPSLLSYSFAIPYPGNFISINTGDTNETFTVSNIVTYNQPYYIGAHNQSTDFIEYHREFNSPYHIVVDDNGNTIAGQRFQIPPFIAVTDPIYAGLGVAANIAAPDGPYIEPYLNPNWPEACGPNIFAFMTLDSTSIDAFGKTKYSNRSYIDGNTIYSLNLHDTNVPPYNANESFTVTRIVTAVSSDTNGHTHTYVATSDSFTDRFYGLYDLRYRTDIGFRNSPPFGGLGHRGTDSPATMVIIGVYDTYDAYGSSGRTSYGNQDNSQWETVILPTSNVIRFANFFGPVASIRNASWAGIAQYWQYRLYDKHTDPLSVIG